MEEKYTIVSRSNEVDLVNDVNELIAEGFIPIGGVSILSEDVEDSRKGYSETYYTYTQAMFRETPN